MDERVVEIVEITMGTLMLLSPGVIAVLLCVWAHRLTARGRTAYLPTAIAACGTGLGVVLLATASEGLGGLGEVLLGMYLLAVGGVATLVCALLIITRRGRNVGAG